MGSIVQRSLPDDSLNGNTNSCVFATTPVPGNLLVFIVHSTSTPDPITAPAGLDLDLALLDAERPTDFYSRPVQAGDPATWTFDSPSTTSSITLAGWELSGVNTAVVPQQALGTPSDATLVTSRTVGPVAATAAGDVVIASTGLSGTSGGGHAVTGGLTLTASLSNRSLFADGVMASGATPSATFSWTTARRSVAGILVYSHQAAVAPRKVWYRKNEAGTWVPGEMIRL